MDSSMKRADEPIAASLFTGSSAADHVSPGTLAAALPEV